MNLQQEKPLRKNKFLKLNILKVKLHTQKSTHNLNTWHNYKACVVKQAILVLNLDFVLCKYFYPNSGKSDPNISPHSLIANFLLSVCSSLIAWQAFS